MLAYLQDRHVADPDLIMDSIEQGLHGLRGAMDLYPAGYNAKKTFSAELSGLQASMH